MNRDTIMDRLIAARELIDTPAKWTQGANERDSEGSTVVRMTSHPVASRCASGAIQSSAIEGNLNSRECASLLDHFQHTIEMRTGAYYSSVMNWNDNPERTHAEVMQAFDLAIDEASQGGV